MCRCELRRLRCGLRIDFSYFEADAGASRTWWIFSAENVIHIVRAKGRKGRL
jgi:hypothetical protein